MISVKISAFGARTPQIGKHRTEATEVTEGGWVSGQRSSVKVRSFRCENPANRKASHRGHGGHRGGIGFSGQKIFGEVSAFGARTTQMGKHRTEATEGDRA
jgi:hypothetical protein